MQDNINYILKVDPASIPWQSLTGPYERSDNVPVWVEQLTSTDQATAEQAKENLAMNIEHQETLWHVTPFAMVLLHRTLHTAVETRHIPVIMRVLKLYSVIYHAAADVIHLDHADPLPHFQDMAVPGVLPADTTIEGDGCDDEDEILEEYYTNIDDSLFYSFFHYSWLVLSYSMRRDFPHLRALKNPQVDEAVGSFNNQALNAALSALLTE